MRPIQLDLPRALRAIRALVEDPDDLPQVFAVIESLSCDTLYRLARRLERSATGRELLARRPDITARLADRAGLARAPEGSLARAYLEFLEREGISPEGIRDASLEGTQGPPLPAPLDWVRLRLRDTHDLWHVVTGYRGDVLGELALLAFTFAQTRNPAAALIVGVGSVQLRHLRSGRTTAWSAVVEGFQRGRAAAWLLEQDWEALLGEPVDDVRRRLGLPAQPAPYREVRSDEYRAARAA